MAIETVDYPPRTLLFCCQRDLLCHYCSLRGIRLLCAPTGPHINSITIYKQLPEHGIPHEAYSISVLYFTGESFTLYYDLKDINHNTKYLNRNYYIECEYTYLSYETD